MDDRVGCRLGRYVKQEWGDNKHFWVRIQERDTQECN